MTARRLLIATALLASLAAGCTSRPNQANIALRKERQALTTRVEQLTREAEQLRSQLRAVESQTPTIDTLPQERLEGLYTAAGIRLGRLTGRASEGGGLVAYVQPYDEDGDALKAVGGVTVEAFDLGGDQGQVRVGQWQFNAGDVRERWLSGALVSGFELRCPWPAGATTQPADRPLLMVVTFTDSLTGRTFEARKDI